MIKRAFEFDEGEIIYSTDGDFIVEFFRGDKVCIRKLETSEFYYCIPMSEFIIKE